MNLGVVSNFKIIYSLRRTFSGLSSLNFLVKSAHVFKELSISKDLFNCFQKGKIDLGRLTLTCLKASKMSSLFLSFLERNGSSKA